MPNKTKAAELADRLLAHADINAIQLKPAYRFQQVYCSQCGGSFGPGNAGFSHCSDHIATRWHELKCDPEVFDAVASGIKTHEIRFDDRGYKVGDGLRLLKTAYTGDEMRRGAPLVYTGAECRRVVSHVLKGYGLAEGWVILSFAPSSMAKGGDDDFIPTWGEVHSKAEEGGTLSALEQFVLDHEPSDLKGEIAFRLGLSEVVKSVRASMMKQDAEITQVDPDGCQKYTRLLISGPDLFTKADEIERSIRSISNEICGAPTRIVTYEMLGIAGLLREEGDFVSVSRINNKSAHIEFGKRNLVSNANRPPQNQRIEAHEHVATSSTQEAGSVM